LVAEFLRRLVDKATPIDRGGVDRHFVRTACRAIYEYRPPCVPPTDCKGHEAGFRGACDHVVDRLALFVAGGDIEKAELIGAGCIVCDSGFDRIACVA
jgi:hypothetical protein